LKSTVIGLARATGHALVAMAPVASLFPVAVLVDGCSGAGGFDQLVWEEQEKFRRCVKPIEPALCGSSSSS
jgi:hypothetical protein